MKHSPVDRIPLWPHRAVVVTAPNTHTHTLAPPPQQHQTAFTPTRSIFSSFEFKLLVGGDPGDPPEDPKAEVSYSRLPGLEDMSKRHD